VEGSYNKEKRALLGIDFEADVSVAFFRLDYDIKIVFPRE
jgi:hypothetical protein